MSDVADLAARVAAMAQAGEQVECYVSRRVATRVMAYGGEVESSTFATTFGVGVRVVRDHRLGFASAGSLDESVVIETLAEARDNATFAEPDAANGLAVPDGVDPPDLGDLLWRADVLTTPARDKVDLAIALERAVLSRDPRITGVRTCTYADGAWEAAVASSTGIAAASAWTSAYLSVSALAAEGDEVQIGGGVDLGRSPAEVDIDVAAGDAVDRAVRLLGATKPPTQRLVVVLEPLLAATLIGLVASTLCADAVLKGRSPFADRVGETMASPLLAFADDATDPRSLAADTHDGEGLATRRTALVDGGVLRGFLYDSYTARRAGCSSTGSAVRGSRSTPAPGVQALAIDPGPAFGPRDLAALVESVDDGLLVASLNGLHSGVNRVSGDFSVGADGLRIRGGALAEPVREITLASTLQRLLLDVQSVATTVEWLLHRGTCAPALAIRDVTMSGA